MKIPLLATLIAVSGCAVTPMTPEEREKNDRLIATLSALNAVYGSPKYGGGWAKQPIQPAQQAPVMDYDWDWDQFYDQYRRLIWVCRGVQTGQFSLPEKCQYKAQLDIRWPGLEYRP